MLLLDLVIGLVTIAVIVLLVTEVLLPAAHGLRFFPSFRSTPLSKKVDETRDELADLRVQTQNLTELEQLLNEKAVLQHRIDELEKKEQK